MMIIKTRMMMVSEVVDVDVDVDVDVSTQHIAIDLWSQ